MTTDEELYRRWLQQRRARHASHDLSDSIMADVAQTSVAQRVSRILALLMWVDRSGFRRLAACVVALAVGSLPFLYMAYISQAIFF